MKNSSGNSRQAFAGLKRLANALKFDKRPSGSSKTFGRMLAEGVAQEIRDRTVGGQSEPSGQSFTPLTATTLAIKAKMGQPSTISIATGEMMRMENVIGTLTVSSNEMSQQEGVSGVAKEHTELFSTGGHGEYADRPYYEMGPGGEHVAHQITKKVLEDAVNEESRR